MLSLITKTRIRGLDAFNLPFLVIDDDTFKMSDKWFKSTLYIKHKVDLELNFGWSYPFSLKISEYSMDKFHPSSMSRENFPLIPV